ncbi:hypothetical protein HA402_004882 [Bradysia odoriphaga]|nr:hypothetical protein HA402_004882 [Bradysia odoriphaga]
MSMEEITTEPLVYVTGFGPFKGHETVNASWEAVRLLPFKHSVRNQPIRIKLLEVPVVYDEVNNYVESIWKDSPKLVIHCGVDGGATAITVEKCANNSSFCMPDWSGKCLETPKICLKNNGSNCDVLTTCLDVEKIVEEVNAVLPEQMLCSSTKVGSYLCGYIYLNSLDRNCERTLFIHVPPVDKPYSSQQTSASILAVLEKCVEQLMDEGKM